MDKDYSTLNAIRDEQEADARWDQTKRRHRVFTGVLILLGAGLAGVAWFAYSNSGWRDSVLSQFPTSVADVQKQVFGLGEQAKATDAKLDDWSSRQEELRSQLNKARGELMARIDSARKQASDASTAIAARVRADIANQLDRIQTQVGKLETSRDSDRQQIAQLQQELTQVREQIRQQSQELAAVQGRVEQHAASSDQEFAAVKATQKQDRHEFDAYADKFAVKRVDFEVNKNRDSTVAPGISVRVNSTDVSYQRLNGSVLASDGRTIWLRQLKVQEPVFLTSFADGRTRELVITRVNKTGAVGYVLMPAQDAAPSPVRAE